jgi:NADPH-dependent 2,4-dienoyl-CoA reductase/sulfur reductase-like enzyme
MRPNLSKDLWKGRPVEKIWRKTEERAELHLNCKAIHLDPVKKYVLDNGGEKYSYDKLLLATGGSPTRLPFGNGDIIYFRTFQDYQRLREMTEHGKHFLVIGGSFIGSEIAAALSMAGKKVTMIFPADGICGNIFPHDLAQFLNDHYLQKGVDVMTKDSVVNVQKEGPRFTVRTRSGRTIEVDGVVAGVGIHTDLDLAREAGVAVDGGIFVNEHMETSVTGVYAAGDVANFQHAALGKRMRVEHEDNAVQMGKLAGRNMAGAHDSYTHVPMFYSDLFEFGYEAVGQISSKMDIISDWQEEPFKKGVFYYLEDDRVRGVLLWNVWKQVDKARALLLEKGPFKTEDLFGRIKE